MERLKRKKDAFETEKRIGVWSYECTCVPEQVGSNEKRENVAIRVVCKPVHRKRGDGPLRCM